MFNTAQLRHDAYPPRSRTCRCRSRSYQRVPAAPLLLQCIHPRCPCILTWVLSPSTWLSVPTAGLQKAQEYHTKMKGCLQKNAHYIYTILIIISTAGTLEDGLVCFNFIQQEIIVLCIFNIYCNCRLIQVQWGYQCYWTQFILWC